MKDIINSFKANLYERTSSPLIGAFIFYWLVCNYKMIVVIFDDKIDSSKKFLNINDLYMNDFFHGIPLNGLIYPLIATLIYLLIFPWISNFIFGIWIYHQNNLKKIGNKKVLTHKEYGELQRKFTELELSFDDTFNKKDNEISQLKASTENKDTLIFEYQQKIENIENELIDRKTYIQSVENDLHKSYDKYNNKMNEIEKLKNEINSLQSIIDNLTPKISDLEQKVMKLFVPNYKELFSISEIKDKLGTDELRAKYTLKKLTTDGYIQSVTKQINPNKFISGYTLTDKGENFLVENNFID